MIISRSQKIPRKRMSVVVTTLGAMAIGLCSQWSMAQTKVIGYIQSDQDMRGTIDRTDLSKLTHINLSFLNPNSSGTFISGGNPVCMERSENVNVTGEDIRYVVTRAQAAGVKVLASVAGGILPPCSGNWATLLNDSNRQRVATNLLQAVNYYNLDGVDIDIEGELLTSIDNNGNYTPFIQALKNGLPADKLLTAATASYIGGMVPISSIPYFDFINIMSYDVTGPGWGQQGIEHSTYEHAEAHIETWVNRGLPKSKLVLGVPFYGWGFGTYRGSHRFSQIIVNHGLAAAQRDVIGTVCIGCDYITYNGIPTIRDKTRLAMEFGSGVMIWALAHDATGPNSLLTAISDEISNGGGSSSSSSSSSSTGTCPSWVEGRQYYAGDRVSYLGGYYIAEHDNPGYVPTISTYFWDPVSASSCGGSSSSSSSSSTPSGTWTAWLNRDNQGGSGDYETRADFGSAVCASPSAIEARVRGTTSVLRPGNSTPDVLNIFSATQGLACRNADQSDGTCSDYEVRFLCSSTGSSSSSSSSSTSFTRLIEAESYANMGGVQLEDTQDPQGGGQNVGWIDATDWMSYTGISIPSAGTYRVEYRVASVSGGMLALDLDGGATSLGQLAIPATGDWQAWTTISHEVELSAGTFAFGIYAAQGGWNINWFRITRI